MYSSITDLLLGDIQISSKINRESFVADAADEIDSRIGLIYVLPLAGTLANYSRLLLKRINNQLATGRLIMAVDAGGDDALHAYGLSLVQSALAELAGIANGMTRLIDTPRLAGDTGVIGPAIVNVDAYSSTEAFEAFAMRGEDTIWRPGP